MDNVTSGCPVNLDWIELEIQKVNKDMVKKKRKKSSYRESKEDVHSTISGKGHIARIK